jgi:hypothetical protein
LPGKGRTAANCPAKAAQQQIAWQRPFVVRFLSHAGGKIFIMREGRLKAKKRGWARNFGVHCHARLEKHMANKSKKQKK